MAQAVKHPAVNEQVVRSGFDSLSYSGLDKLGRVALSKCFHLREFLYSEIAVEYRLRNVPDKERATDAIASGTKLCELLLQPLQDTFGRVHVRSGYRSRAVNAAGVDKHNCARDNDGFHIWEYPSTAGHGAGATACISIPRVSKQVFAGRADELALAWWIHDNLPSWSCLEFFSTPRGSDELAFNIGWHERPMKVIHSWRGGPRTVHSIFRPSKHGDRVGKLFLLHAPNDLNSLPREPKCLRRS